MTKPSYVYFWTTAHVNGWASQWYPAAFKATLSLDPKDASKPEEEFEFPTTEHWMMVQKAILFGDADIARRVLAIRGTTSADMRRVKALGREVRGFHERRWAEHRERIVFEGNLLKFAQNKELWEKLDATGDSVIVEASPRDKIWGIGIGEKRATAGGKEAWRGQNLLGQAITKVRTQLREETTEGSQKKRKLEDGAEESTKDTKKAKEDEQKEDK
jgi:ribA/ribD-fused uncharacterized protein